MSSPLAPELTSSPLLKPQEFYTKILILKEVATDSHSLYTFMVDRLNYSLHVGRNILCNVGSFLIEMFFVERLSTVLVCVPGRILLYCLRTNKTNSYEFQYSSITEVQNDTFLMVCDGGGLCMLLHVE